MPKPIYANSYIVLHANEASDDSLVLAVQKGDREAYAELFNRHRDRLFRVVIRITLNSHDAEDVLQDSWMRAFTHINSFNRKSAFFTWMTRIAINSALMHLRKRRRHNELSLDEQPGDNGFLLLDIASGSPSPEQLCLATEQHGLIDKAATRLSPVLRTTFALRHSRNKSIEEIAREMGISNAAVKSRLLRARLALRTPFSIWSHRAIDVQAAFTCNEQSAGHRGVALC